MTGCAFEKDLSLALHEGRWPAACDSALQAHVTTCASCSDLVLVTTTLQHARAAATQVPALPSPGVLWWRAQVRRRNAANERMSRPIVFTEVVTLLATLAALGFAIFRFVDWMDWTSLSARLLPADFHSSAIVAAMPTWMPPMLAVAAIVFFAAAGFAVYTLAHNE
jgi:hypothetical protein